jgi:hypothetical protein
MSINTNHDHPEWDRRHRETLRQWKVRLGAETTEGLGPVSLQHLLGLRLTVAMLLDQDEGEARTRQEKAALKKHRMQMEDARRVLASLSPDELHEIINWVARGMPAE